MSENKQVDKSQTIINYEDVPTLPPPRLEVGAVAWLRQNLFGSPADIVITILSTLLIITLVVSFFDWSIRTANWFAIINNQRLFMLETFDRILEWRVALTVLISALLTGVSFAVWARRSMRTLTMFGIGMVAFIALLPPLITATIPQPPSYFAAGNVEIVDRASTQLPQPELAFIAQAGETVEVNIAERPASTLENLSNLSGFSDRSSNALSNAAQNRIDQQAENIETYERMISRELTEVLEERTRLGIQTATRTNDMVASTIEFSTILRDNFAEGEWGVSSLELWIARLDDAVGTLDEGDEAVESAIEAVDTAIETNAESLDAELAEIIETSGITLENDVAVPDDVMETVDALTMTLIESENLEDIGEALVDSVVVDLIGEEAQPDEQEELLDPTPLQAEFLRDMYVILLTPQSVIETYSINQTDMSVEILDGQSLEVLAEGIVSVDGEPVSLEIPTDGWYVLRKVPVEGEDGTAILAVNGVFPLVERTLSATESLFVRLTDDELEVTATRPQIDGGDVPIAALIDNQYRGLRDLSTYLVHFVPLFLEQVDRLFLPFVLVIAWGFAVGRALAHLLGENTRFNNLTSRLTLIATALSPLLIVLAYFALIDGAFGFSPVGDFAGAILKIALAVGAVFLAGQIDSWLNRINSGEDTEASITSTLLYAWGIYPVLMFILISGIGDFSGATLGSGVGGLLWLGVMYYIGLNYKGMLGYGLVIGGFFLQIIQTHVIDIVWDTWTDSDPTFALIWLVLVVIGVGAGIFGHMLRDKIDFASKRLGYMIGTLGFLFVFAEVSGDFETLLNDPVMALVGIVFLLWIMWMFFTGSHTWTANRVVIGILFITYFAMEVYTPIDKWSIIYFIIWLAVGAYAFTRGIDAQREQRKTDEGAPASAGFAPLARMVGLTVAWAVALVTIPSLITGMDSSGILQTSPNDLLPLSDKRAWGGLMLTMQLTILGVGASFPIGLALALGRRSNLPVVKTACILYIEAVRGVPLITVLFLATLLVPLIDPTLATIEGAVRVWVGVTMFSAAYLAENVRGGLQSIPKGQTEAAQAIGLSQWQTTVSILLPQALRAVIPALVGQFISLFKDTSLVVIVGLAEITGIANRVVAQPEFLQKRQETYLYIAIIYFVFSYIMSYISRRVEETGSGAARARQI